MSTQSISLFQAIGTRIDFLNQRQVLISQNVANADTPGYRPRDLQEQDFGAILKNVTNQGGVQMVSTAATNAKHIGNGAGVDDPRVEKQRETYEVTLAGNAVVIEEQLVKANENNMNYTLMTNLYQKNIGLINTALGTNQ